jgi:RNA polymerase sigma-70 factor (ECF subfamily)
MDRGPDFDAAILPHRPKLFGIAMSLCRDISRAQDLVQDTMVKAYGSAHLFDGQDPMGWLATILNNTWRTKSRRAAREVQDVDGNIALRQWSPPNQVDRIALREATRIMLAMPACRRDALVLVGMQGMTYERAAAAAGVAVGTMKSRVSRARGQLAQQMGAFA